MVDGLEQPAHEVVSPFVQDELDDRAPSRNVDDGEGIDLDQPVLQLNAVAQPASERARIGPGTSAR